MYSTEVTPPPPGCSIGHADKCIEEFMHSDPNFLSASWNRHIYNHSNIQWRFSVDETTYGNFYILMCDKHANFLPIKNGTVTLEPGETCNTKLTTTKSSHETKISLVPMGQGSGSQYWVWRDITTHSTGLTIQHNGNTGCATLNRPAAADIEFICDSDAKGGYGAAIRGFPAAQEKSILNYVPQTIIMGGNVSTGGIKLIQAAQGQEKDMRLEDQEFEIKPAAYDEKGNLVRDTFLQYTTTYYPQNMLGYLWFLDTTTNKRIGVDISYNLRPTGDEFTISQSKFDYFITISDGQQQKVRVLLNVTVTDDAAGALINSPGSMVICPVGFKGIAECMN